MTDGEAISHCWIITLSMTMAVLALMPWVAVDFFRTNVPVWYALAIATGVFLFVYTAMWPWSNGRKVNGA